MFNIRGNSLVRWQEPARGSRSRATLLSWVAGVARSVATADTAATLARQDPGRP